MKIRVLIIVLASSLFIFLAIYFFPGNSVSQGALEVWQNKAIIPQDEVLPFKAGETITYQIKLNGINIGRATLSYKGRTKLEGKDVYLILFSTDTLNFKDTEIMYADTENFLPLRIERDINNWGRKMSIIEEYDQANHSVRITQINKKRVRSKELKQDDKIQNVILLTFLYRKLGNFELGRDFPVTLPMAKFIMRFAKQEKLVVPFGVYQAHMAESFPKGHKIWFEVSEKFIPVKISGPFYLGPVTMTMINYE
ncbi:MAG: DUF3108 domain-containing protein [Candidatus Omnitrophota bacterium]|nr:DUF3108 domain-containing protein [Candidatus Omnitrophota bacterium]